MKKIIYGLWLATFLNVSFYSAIGAAQDLEIWSEQQAPVFTPYSALVRSSSDFKEHIVLHKARVKILAVSMAKIFHPETVGIVGRHIAEHDDLKFQDGVFKELYSMFGLNENTMNAQMKARRAKVTNYMAEQELEMNKQFFARLGHYSKEAGFDQTAKDIMLIEKLADLTDRYRDPIARLEFGRVMRPVSQFINVGVPEGVMLKYLDLNYDRLVKGFRYQDYAEGSCDRLLRSLVH